MGEIEKKNERPWGSFQNHYSMPGVHLKTLHINPSARLSLQRHKHRNETWVLVSGDAQAIAGPTPTDLTTTELSIDVPYYVPVGTVHRLASQNGAVLVEISYGQFDEDDIERFEDDFGRVASESQ